MSDTDPLFKIRRELEKHEGKPLSVTLAAEEVEALREALVLARRYPHVQGVLLRASDSCNQVRDVRREFQRDRSVKAETRALRAVRKLGWMDTDEAKRIRGLNVLYYYRLLITEGGDPRYPVALIDDGDTHPDFAPKQTFVSVPDAPLDRQDAINRLAGWYEAKPLSIRQWLKDARVLAKEDLKQADSGRSLYLHGLLEAKLPWSD